MDPLGQAMPFTSLSLSGNELNLLVVTWEFCDFANHHFSTDSHFSLTPKSLNHYQEFVSHLRNSGILPVTWFSTDSRFSLESLGIFTVTLGYPR